MPSKLGGLQRDLGIGRYAGKGLTPLSRRMGALRAFNPIQGTGPKPDQAAFASHGSRLV